MSAQTFEIGSKHKIGSKTATVTNTRKIGLGHSVFYKLHGDAKEHRASTANFRKLITE